MSFESLGLLDPFPDENSNLVDDSVLDTNDQIKMESQVYPASRFTSQSPRCIFIPSKQVMLKLIKACMGCESPNDLWFNR